MLHMYMYLQILTAVVGHPFLLFQTFNVILNKVSFFLTTNILCLATLKKVELGALNYQLLLYEGGVSTGCVETQWLNAGFTL